jgi:hypothetical protein
MTDDMFNNHMSNIKVTIIIHTKMVIDGHSFYSKLNLLWIICFKNALRRPFGTKSCALRSFLYFCRFYILTFVTKVHERKKYAPSIHV